MHLGLNPDHVNAVFEGCGSLFILNHCRVLLKQKAVLGVSIMSIAFFNSWGMWNVWYYPYLQQTFSYYAGISIMLANTLYLSMMLYYTFGAKYKRLWEGW